jgi:two-component system chemotaxis sensor kinase CheA
MLADDPALLAAFLDESRDSLAGLEASLIALDGSPDLRADVEAIFRPVHTLKGNAPFFGFMEIQRLAHALETVLDLLRKGHLPLSQAVTDALLAGLDGLRVCIERVRSGEPEIEDAAAFTALTGRLAAINAPTSQPTDPWARVFADLADLERHDDQLDLLTQQRIARLAQGLAALNSFVHTPAPSDDPAAGLRRRLAKPLATPLEADAAEAVMSDLRALRAACQDSAQVKEADDLIATCQVFIGSVGFDDMVRQHVLEKLPLLVGAPASALEAAPVATSTPKPIPPADQPATERRTRKSDTETETYGKSMRVSEAAVDGFLTHVGELLVIGDQLAYLQLRLAASDSEPGLVRDMRQAVASFSVLSSELQRSIMGVRQVPVRSLLQKAPRLVRDIAQATGKDIIVEVAGEAVEVDKSRLELLDGPLTHLIRNCADHGIESPEKRVAAGKPARGTITLTASTVDGWFTLQIADDGRGLDLAAIQRKGEALGLVQAGQALDQRAIIDLIFASGLSTAAAVSDVSGRGVGMDVVKRQILDAGGTVTVTTAQGQGTTFCLRMPCTVSTQIVPAFLVRDGPGIFALPLELVRESFADAQAHADGSAGVVLRHGAVLPVAPLGRLLGQDGAPPDGGRRTCVTIERNQVSIAVSVSEILGVRRLVIRPLNGISAGDLDGRFQGAALLGDGQLALVVDPDHLLRRIAQKGSHA